MRIDGRTAEQLRPIQFQTGFIEHHPASVLVSFGKTRVLAVATLGDRVPAHRVASGGGWLTAEYAMLPTSTHDRNNRAGGKPDGRAIEIQRLIGRSLRGAINLDKLGPYQIQIDCDVIQADGGTRTASITGGWLAAALCIAHFAAGKLPITPQRKIVLDKVIHTQIAAVSVGILGNQIISDLCYQEDSKADTDMNVVGRHDGCLIEIQGTAEGQAMSRSECDALIDAGLVGIDSLCALQRAALRASLSSSMPAEVTKVLQPSDAYSWLNKP